MVLVLHGPEGEIFHKDNYDKYKNIADLTARLNAFNVINVRVCRARMRLMEIKEPSLYPFVGTAAFGAAEIFRLLKKEDCEYF